ncbi:hypothetical protein D3C86_1944420 [compost metagenome]
MVASARPVRTSWIDWSKPSVPTSSAPEACASLPKLLVSDWADFLPLRSAKSLISASSPLTISTALEAI